MNLELSCNKKPEKSEEQKLYDEIYRELWSLPENMRKELAKEQYEKILLERKNEEPKKEEKEKKRFQMKAFDTSYLDNICFLAFSLYKDRSRKPKPIKNSSAEMYDKILKAALADFDCGKGVFNSGLSYSTLKVRKSAINHAFKKVVDQIDDYAKTQKIRVGYAVQHFEKIDPTFRKISQILFDNQTVISKEYDHSNTTKIRTDRTRPVKLEERTTPIEMLKALGKGWQSRLLDTIDNEEHKLIISTLIATGCRPNELETGITVSANEKNNLVFKVPISKSEHLQSKTHKYIEVERTHRTMKPFDFIAVGEEFELKSAIEKTRSIVKRLDTDGKEINVKCFRHQKRVDMLRQQCTKRQIQITFGHKDKDSQKAYGSAELSSCGPRVVRAYY